MEIKIKKLNSRAILPSYATSGSAGLDLCACIEEKIEVNPGEVKIIPIGVSIALPEFYEAQIRPRSGLAAKNGITVLNSPGTIDSDYRGEIKVILINHGLKPFIIENEMRIAQMVIAPVSKVDFIEQDFDEKETKRGSAGFGSTDNYALNSGAQLQS
ncbi:MAG: dUTP diphosphatase [Rickettsiaceae bacterium]|nr:dUTP diphosphatase [Rickettsiaceae bacterium]